MAVVDNRSNKFYDAIICEAIEHQHRATKSPSINVTQMSRDEVIEHAHNAIWEYVPTQGVKREYIDFNFATTEQIKKWLVTNYGEFFYY